MKFKDKMLFTEQLSNEQKIFKFDNGFGASVIRNEYTYGGNDGLWELAVLKFDKDENWELTYKTPITSDVLGYLTEQDVDKLLTKINDLKKECE